MKTTDKTTAHPSNDSQLDAIDTAVLDDVTGGCACGQTCANGPAVTNAVSQLPAPAFRPFARA